MNVQWALLDTWWKNWMGMSGQLWLDSGNQKHSDLDQPGCWTRQKASHDSTDSEATKKTRGQAGKRMLKRVKPPSRQVDKMAYGIISSLFRISWPCPGGL